MKKNNMRLSKISGIYNTIKSYGYVNNILNLLLVYPMNTKSISLEYSNNKLRISLSYINFKLWLSFVYSNDKIRISSKYSHSKNKTILSIVYNKFIFSLSFVYSYFIHKINKDLKSLKTPVLSTLKAFEKIKNNNIFFISCKIIEFIKTFSFFINSFEFIANSKSALLLLYMGAKSKSKNFTLSGLVLPLLSPYKEEKVK